MWIIIIFFLQYCFCFIFLSPGIWDLSLLTRDQTHIPCIGRQSLDHWTARVSLFLMFLIIPITLKFDHLYLLHNKECLNFNDFSHHLFAVLTERKLNIAYKIYGWKYLITITIFFGANLITQKTVHYWIFACVLLAQNQDRTREK